jgi:hypothetical protein
VIAAWLLLLAAPILDWRRAARSWRARIAAPARSRRCSWRAARARDRAGARWSTWPLVTGEAYTSSLAEPFLSSPLDFPPVGVPRRRLVAVSSSCVRRPARTPPARRPSTRSGALRLRDGAVLAGAAAAIVLLVHTALLRDTVAESTLDLLRLSLPPWNGATLALQAGLVAAHAATLRHHRAAAPGGAARGGCGGAGTARSSRSAAGCCRSSFWNGLIRLHAAEQMPQMAALRRRHRDASSRARSAPATATARRRSA